MSTVVRALVTVLLLAGLVAAPPAQAAGDDWRLLYSDGALRTGTGALKSEIPTNISTDFPAARFSPDGTRLATWDLDCLDDQCTEIEGTARIYRPDGSSFRLAGVTDLAPHAVAWSPDGTRVAVLGDVLTPGDNDVRIYLLPVDGGTPVMVYSDTLTLRIFEYGGLSWNADTDRLAFIATEFEQENGAGPYFSVPGASDQVWTVAAAALSTPYRFTGTPVCGDCSHAPGYRQPTWSPDGSRLAVLQYEPLAEFGTEAPPFVGYLAPGALSATELTAAVPEDQLAWSGDGDYLAYGIYDTTDDFYDETEVVDADTGDVVEVVEGVIAPFVDWLPCPGGSCQVWQDVYVAPIPFLNLKGRAKAGKIVATGEMGRVEEVETVSVTLHKRTKPGGRWRKVASVEVEAVEGLFKKAFPRPRAVQCRVKAVLTRDPRASDSAVFRC